MKKVFIDGSAGTMFTGKKEMTVKETDKIYIAGTYNRFPVVLSSGKGSIVKDEKGKEQISL